MLLNKTLKIISCLFLNFFLITNGMDPKRPILDLNNPSKPSNRNTDSQSELKELNDRTQRDHLAKSDHGGKRPSNQNDYDYPRTIANYNYYDDSDDSDDDDDSYENFNCNNNPYIQNADSIDYQQPDLLGIGDAYFITPTPEKPNQSNDIDLKEIISSPSPEISSSEPTSSQSSYTYNFDSLQPGAQSSFGSQKSNPQENNATHSAQIEIDESEFENLPSPSSLFNDPAPHQTNQTRSTQQRSNSQTHSAQKPYNRSNSSSSRREQESYSGIDNLGWNNDNTEKKRTVRKKDSKQKAQIYKNITKFLQDDTVPLRFRERLQYVVDGNVQGEVDFNQTEAQFNDIQKEYKQTVLYALRIQENLSPELIEHRRNLEFELLTKENRSSLYSEDKKIKKEKKSDIARNIYSWDFFLDMFRPSKLQNLIDKYKNKKKEHRNKTLDNISEQYKSEYKVKKAEEEKRLKIENKQLKKAKAAQIKKKREFQERFRQMGYQLGSDRMALAQLKYLYFNPALNFFTYISKSLANLRKEKKKSHNKQSQDITSEHKPEEKLQYFYLNNEASSKPNERKNDNLTFADTELIIVDENFNPTIDLMEPSLDSLDFITTDRAQKYLNNLDIDPKEFKKFQGNPEQESVHNKLTQTLENLSNTPPSLPALFAYQSIFKTIYDLNKTNYPEVALKLLDLLDLLTSPASLYLALGNEIIDTVGNPKGYMERRIQGFKNYSLHQFMTILHSARAVALQCKEISKLTSSNLSFLEKYDIINNAVKTLLVTLYELHPFSIKFSDIKALYDYSNSLSLQERRKVIAQNIIDMTVDYAVLSLLFKGVNFTFARNTPLRPHVYDTTWEPLAKPEFDIIQSTKKVATPKLNAVESNLPIIPKNINTPEVPITVKEPVTFGQIIIGEKLIRVGSEPIDLIKDPKTVIYQVPIDEQNKVITEFMIRKKDYNHIFSDKHINIGEILELGTNRTDILSKVTDIIIESDKAGLIKNGQTNQIETIINGCDVCVRVHLQDGKILSCDAFRIFEPMKRQTFNCFKFILEKYK